MKKATVQISYDAEKLGAVKQYMNKKDAELQAELEDFIQKLYEKYVPATVREYIESRDSGEAAKTKSISHPTASAASVNNIAGGNDSFSTIKDA